MTGFHSRVDLCRVARDYVRMADKNEPSVAGLKLWRERIHRAIDKGKDWLEETRDNIGLINNADGGLISGNIISNCCRQNFWIGSLRRLTSRLYCDWIFSGNLYG